MFFFKYQIENVDIKIQINHQHTHTAGRRRAHSTQFQKLETNKTDYKSNIYVWFNVIYSLMAMEKKHLLTILYEKNEKNEKKDLDLLFFCFFCRCVYT